MKGLLFFYLESENQAFDAELYKQIVEDQENHSAVYHLETVRVRIGAREDSLTLEPETVWQIRTGGMGDVVDLRTQVSFARQLSTYLYGRIVANNDAGCAAVFINNGTAQAGTAAVQLSLIVSSELCSLYSVRIHNFLLQNQYAYQDPQVARLVRQIEKSNAFRPVFYTSQYILPWESINGAQEGARQTVAALIKTMMMAGADPMMLTGVGTQNWVETAAIRRLEPPVERIVNAVFRYLSQHFYNKVLSPAVSSPDSAVIQPKKANDCVRQLKGYVKEIERNTLLPPFEDLMCIMPLKNPAPGMRMEEGMSETRAWDVLFNLYGRERGVDMQNRLNPSLKELEEQYREFGASLTMELLRQVFLLARDNGQDFATLPHLVKQIGEALINQSSQTKATALEIAPYAHGMFLPKERKKAISMARVRHGCLEIVYRAATNRLATKRRDMCTQVMRDAVNQAQQFIRDCMFRLNAVYQPTCDIYLNRRVEANCYDTLLEAAYEYWCGNDAAVVPLTSRDLYALFTDEVFSSAPKEAAQLVCDGLMEQLHQRTGAAVDSIRVNIDRFFPELAFRAKQLEKQGLQVNLYSSLLKYLNEQTMAAPLLYQERAGDIIGIKARALIFHQVDAGQFVSLAQNAGVEVVNDPHERGVQLVVKYAGNALEDVLMVQSNPQELLRG